MNCQHTDDGLCAQCADDEHRMLHPYRVEGCLACKLDSIQFGASIAPRNRHNPVPPRKVEAPSWEKGLAGTHRPDGSFMPYLKSDLSPMHVKEASEKRGLIEEHHRRLQTSTNP